MQGQAIRRGGRPTLDDARRKSEQLLTAATALFVERGFDAATMEAVALAAGIGKQAVYQRYPNKEALFAAVIARLSDEGEAAMPRHDDRDPLAPGLASRVHDYLRYALNPRSQLVCRLVMREGHRFPQLVMLLQQVTLDRMIRPLAAFLGAAAARGEARPADMMAVASACVDLVFAEAMRSAFQQRTLSAAQVRRAAETIVGVVGPGLEIRGGEGAAP